MSDEEVSGNAEDMRTIRITRDVEDADYWRSVLAKDYPPSLQEKRVMNNKIREAIREAMTEGYFTMVSKDVSLVDSEVVVNVQDFKVTVSGMFRE